MNATGSNTLGYIVDQFLCRDEGVDNYGRGVWAKKRRRWAQRETTGMGQKLPPYSPTKGPINRPRQFVSGVTTTECSPEPFRYSRLVGRTSPHPASRWT